jgi:muramoyltetrapeptide carboxypeptidase
LSRRADRLLPAPLRRGDLVGVCAPAGPVDPDALRRGVDELVALGFEVRLAPGVLARTGFTAGSAERRAADLRLLLEDDDVRAVVCARGGAGAGRVVARLDVELVREGSKLLLGYSDVTFLHLAYARAGVVSLHGPMAARELADAAYDRDSLWHALTGEGDPYHSSEGELAVLRRGEAEGVLRGGCLSILAAAAGTPWALGTDEDTILFLEDVDERPYRIDRMLGQLRASGAFASVRGVVFGEMPGCLPDQDAGYSLSSVLLEALEGLDVPVALGLASGHTTRPAVTLPLGVCARLECGEGASLAVLESATEATA